MSLDTIALIAPEIGEIELVDLIYETPEQMIVTSPAARKTFDDFMWIYAGDPFLNHFPEIRRNHPLVGECTYGNRLMSYCYSQEGSLVHIRRSWEIHQDCCEADYFVATANLVSGEPLVEWEILKVAYIRKRPEDGLEIELLLRNSANTAQLVLNSQNFIWSDGNAGKSEVLMPGSELSTKLKLAART